ncbi:hypothetical protein ACFLY6_00635 [Candidatus Dependentiae bacterium]
MKELRQAVRLLVVVFSLVFVSSNVFAVTYNFSDTTIGRDDDDPSADGGKIYYASATDDTVTLDGTITVSGEVIFKAADGRTLTISVGGVSSTDVFMHSTSTYTVLTDVPEVLTGQCGHLCFCPDAGGQIIVDVTQDFYLTGSNINTDESIGDIARDGSNELVMTFTGQGQTVFKIADNKSMICTSMHMEGEETGSPTFVENTSTGSGVSIYVAMDDTAARAETAGINKVVFQRGSGYSTGGTNEAIFELALNSYLMFVSNNIDGKDATSEQYAGIAFDVSNDQKGRLKLKLSGPTTYATYTDGAMNLSGLFLSDGTGDYTTAGAYTEPNDFRSYVNFSQHAGSKAYMRVIDELAFADATYKAAVEGDSPYNVGGSPSRRGLLISNTCKSIPTFASDPYGDAGWYYQDVPFTGTNHLGNKNIRPGFVLGINGHIEVFHNTFIEYEAGATNQDFAPADYSLNTLVASITAAGVLDVGLVFKQHNGSAFFVDGLGDTYVGATLLTEFEAHSDADILRHAEITLLGDSRLTVRAPILGSTGLYNKLKVPVTGETTGDGVYVMDIEGWLTTRSEDDDAAAPTLTFGRHIGTSADKAGQFRMASLWRSYDDREILNETEAADSYISRPLTANSAYYRYDRPAIFTNASFDFVDLHYHHEDITRDVQVDPSTALPAIVGGEKATFRADVLGVTNPDITFFRPYDSTLHLHESLCMSGVRLAMREKKEAGQSDAKNETKIIFYNHGDILDTTNKGWGRALILGTKKNEVASGGTSIYTENAYMNIFRHNEETDLLVTLSLQTADEFALAANDSEKAMQLIYMANDSYIDVGWTTTQGIFKDSSDTTVYPWDRSSLGDQDTVACIPPGASYQFDLDTATIPPATFSLDGDLIYLGGKNTSGTGSPDVITATDMGRVIYMNHGAKITIGSDTTVTPTQPYVAFSDAAIAMRVWKASTDGLNTIINLPRDQMHLAKAIQPYGMKMNTLTDLLVTTDKYLSFTSLTGSGLGTEVRIAWDKVEPVPGLEIMGYSDFWKAFNESRAIAIDTTPVTMPTYGLIKMTTDDYLDQLLVSGATAANPFSIYLSGDSSGHAQVREIASAASDYLVPGEGANARIFLDHGARLGLGSRDWNEHSDNAWSLLGKNRVALRPNGSCIIDVNSDLVIADPQPIVPTTDFGGIDATALAAGIEDHRVTFFSHDTREIRIPSGQEFDLSAFGQQTTSEYATQKVELAGKVRLIFEPGSALRFPDMATSQSSLYPVLYVNQESEVIFEGIQDDENTFAWDESSDTDRARIKIYGCGQIWVNKRAKLHLNDGAMLAIESDSTTPRTDVTLSLQREAEVLIGDENHAGGSFQIGNPTSVDDSYINFKLRLDGAKSFFHIGREGFVGFGAGTVQRSYNRINGRSSSPNWKFKKLYNVSQAHVALLRGIINHNNIYDGSSKEGSLWTFGPVTTSTGYRVEVGPDEATIRGGGNLLYLSDDLTNLELYSTATALVYDTALDNGKYNIMAPSLEMAQTTHLETQDANTTIDRADAGNASESDLIGGFLFEGPQTDAFLFLGASDIKAQGTQNTGETKQYGSSKYVSLGKTQFEHRVGYMYLADGATNGTIVRTNQYNVDGPSNAEDLGMIYGALKGANSENEGIPTAYTIP